MVDHELFDNRFTGKLVAEAVRRLFEEDGTVYLAAGYLTWSGYITIREPLVAFLDRDPGNRAVFVVSTGADQFSRLVAHALWALDAEVSDAEGGVGDGGDGAGEGSKVGDGSDVGGGTDSVEGAEGREAGPAGGGTAPGDRVQLLTYRDGFIHPKLYLRDGEQPAFVMGSANLTWDGLGKNLELAWYYAPEDRGDSIFLSHLEWMISFVDASVPVTAADLSRRVRLRRTVDTWSNKGRINLPLMVRGALPFGRRGRAASPTDWYELPRDDG